MMRGETLRVKGGTIIKESIIKRVWEERVILITSKEMIMGARKSAI
jgi:hypothetical protein